MKLYSWFLFTCFSLLFTSPVMSATNKVVVIPLNSSSAASGGGITTVFFDCQNNTGDPWSLDPRYCGIAGQSTGSAADGHIFPVTRSGTVTNFRIYVTTNNLSTKSVTISFVKNGSAAGPSITTTVSSSGLITSSTEISLNAGDRFAVYALVDGATATSEQIKVGGAFDIEYN